MFYVPTFICPGLSILPLFIHHKWHILKEQHLHHVTRSNHDVFYHLSLTTPLCTSLHRRWTHPFVSHLFPLSLTYNRFAINARASQREGDRGQGGCSCLTGFFISKQEVWFTSAMGRELSSADLRANGLDLYSPLLLSVWTKLEEAEVTDLRSF